MATRTATKLAILACLIPAISHCSSARDDAPAHDAGMDAGDEPLDPEVAYATELRSLEDLEVLTARRRRQREVPRAHRT